MRGYEARLGIAFVVLVFYADECLTATDIRSTSPASMKEYRTTSKPTAVQQERVYPAGSVLQGAISNLSKPTLAAR